MRTLLIAGLLLGGCTPARMAGFDALAPSGERLDVTGVPAFASGGFRLGSAAGHVRRVAEGVTRTTGTGLPPGLSAGETARRGTLAFRVAGAEVGGLLEGDCRYDRAEDFVREDAGTGVSIAESAVSRPLALDCRYRLDGRDAGRLVLDALPPRPGSGAEPRAGRVEWGRAMLAVRSSHDVAGAGETSQPIGYVVEGPDGVPVAAAELNSVGARRLVLPRDASLRPGALAALLTLALFWDPGDTD